MEQLLFNAQESRLIAISFVQKLLEEFGAEFTEEGRAHLLKAFDCLINDPLYEEVWRETCEVVFGRVFTPKSLLTKEEIYTNLIEFCVRFIYEWGVDLSEAVRALFKIRFNRDDGFLELKQYQAFLDTPLLQEKGATTYSVSVFKASAVKPNFSIHKNMFLGYAKLLMPEYLYRLREYKKSYFSDKSFQQFTHYASIVRDDPAFESELFEDIYLLAFGRICNLPPETSTDAVFTLMIQHCAYYVFGFKLCTREVLNYLFLIRYKPEFCQYENEIWMQELEKVVYKYNY
jgi:hypothetical protein